MDDWLWDFLKSDDFNATFDSIHKTSGFQEVLRVRTKMGRSYLEYQISGLPR